MREFMLVAIGFALGSVIGIQGLVGIVQDVIAQLQGVAS